MQFWWAPKDTPPDRIAYFEGLFRRIMETKTVRERLKQLHIAPEFHTGKALQETIKQRSANLEGITIEKPPPLPPVHWMILGLVAIGGVMVWRENRISPND